VDAGEYDDLVAKVLEDQHVWKPPEKHAAHVAMDPRILRRCLLHQAGGGMDGF
jgi:hypothetical protein